MNRLGAHTSPWMLMLFISLSCCASSPWSPLVGRTTNDRDADLVNALIGANRFDDAQAFCQAQLRGVEPEGDAAAKWTIRHSQVLAARQKGSDHFEDAEVKAAQRPTLDFLDSYPQHRRRLFLEAQNVAVQREAALHSVLLAAVSATNPSAMDVAFKRLLRATTEVVSLSQRVAAARSRLSGQRGAGEIAMVADLIRLQQELQVDAVSMALMQTELFPRGSDDCVAAATKAEQAADEAIDKLPAASVARREVERLKVEAIFRGGQLGRAETQLATLVRALGQPTPPRVQAIQVRVDVAKKRLQAAGARLNVFYGSSPQRAPKSIEMDLARLDFLMQGGRTGEVGAWLDIIEQRGGGFARRRAEAISLALLRSTGDSTSEAQMVDPSLVAAQGQDWLRRGNAGRGAELLSAAAAAESDPDRAIRHASEAAAAFVSADRTLDAAGVLAKVSLAKPSGANAAAAHLQAALLISQSKLADATDRIESLLRANLNQWPTNQSAVGARAWLLKILSSQDRHLDAAEVATQIPIDHITGPEVEKALELWRTALRSSDVERFAATATRFQDSFRPLLARDDLSAAYLRTAALLLDRDSLAGLPSAAKGSGNSFVDALLVFRRQGTVSDDLSSAPADLVEDATWRLMRDGQTYLQHRESIARTIGNWTDGSTASLGQAERLLWLGEFQKSIAMLRQLAQQSPNSSQTMKDAAELLGSSDHRESRDAAIELWDQLAAGAKQGSRTWHEAKIAAISLLAQTGKKNEAQRRAKYILLTMPAIESTWKQQYKAAME